MRSIVPALATLSLVASASAKVIHVPDACSTLADAVKAAVDGDEIVLAPMKHLAAAVEIGKEITIRSFDPTDREIVAQTIVMPPSDIAKYDVYAFRFEEVGSGALLDGLTIAHYGSKEKPSWAYSAVSIFRASPRIRNCVISDNYLVTAIGGLEIILGEPVIENCQIRYNHGPEAGGVYIGPFSRPRFLNTQIDNNDGSGVYIRGRDSRPVFTDCAITHNQDLGGAGGGVFVYSESSASFVDCFIYGNRAEYGGGIACGPRMFDYPGGSVELTNCRVTFNYADSYGAGAHVFRGGSLSAVHTEFAFNRTEKEGGALCADPASHTDLTACLFDGNEASVGGALSARGSAPVIDNCVFNANQAVAEGGAIYSNAGDVGVTNCTFVANTAFSGGALSNTAGGSTRILNSILHRNTSIPILSAPDKITVAFSNVDGGWPGEGNTSNNPRLFTFDKSTPHFLHKSSLCIDAGDPAIDDTADWDSVAPWYGGANGPTSDMGAYGGAYGDWWFGW